MPQTLSSKNRRDDVERIVATLRSDPQSLEEVKSFLRDRLKPENETQRARVPLSVVPASDDAEEMWDNVPV